MINVLKCSAVQHAAQGHVGESGALPCMGQIRSQQFLEKLLAVDAQENARLFLVWLTIVQRMKLQDVCNLIGKIPDMCFTSAFETFVEDQFFLILTQNKGSALQNSL